MIQYSTHHIGEQQTPVRMALFASGGLPEASLFIYPSASLFEDAAAETMTALESMYAHESLRGMDPVFMRWFLSDITNQAAAVPEHSGEPFGECCPISVVGQPQLGHGKAVLWVHMKGGIAHGPYLISSSAQANSYGLVEFTDGILEVRCANTRSGHSRDSYAETGDLLSGYGLTLNLFQLFLEKNCVRTWFFVRDVDTQYHGLVVARRENFEREGLTSHTHYIASTGIGGSPADTRALVQLGSLAVLGLHPRQQRYLYAPTHLNPTYEYGVTFERGTAVSYGDRSHIYISGTASIDNKGQVMHVGDVVAQTRRMWENVETLLAEAGASFADVMQIIVYLRDTADAKRVTEMFHERFPNIPTVVTLAPVCRPTWLIEMECIAVRPASNPEFRPF